MTALRAPVPRRGRRLPAAVAAAAAAALLAGCVSIPTEGPISRGSPAPAEQSLSIPLPLGPQEGSDEEEIVAGFLSAAQAGVFQDYATARQFLAPGTEWDPRPATMVASQNPVVTRTGAGSVVVDVELAAQVDESGVYREATRTPGPELQLPFELRQVAGEWRISSLPDGVVFRDSAFVNAYAQVPLYFATPDRTVAVPDVRWLPSTRGTLLLRTVQALLAGPSPWLRDAVVTALPNLGSALEDVAGPDAAGVVTVGLSSEVNAVELPDDARELLQAQLEATLMSSNLRGIAVSGVEVTVRGSPWEVQPSRVDPLVLEVLPGSGPYAVADARVVEVRGQEEPVPVDGLPSLGSMAAHHPAVSVDEDVWVVLDGPRRLVLLPTDGSGPVTLHEGADDDVLLPPSVDRFDWTWTGAAASGGTLLAVSPAGEVVEVSAPWLAGRQVGSIRVSRGGSRVAIASVGVDGATTLEVAAVIRNASGVPQLLGEERLAVGAHLTEVTEITWLDGASLAVLGTEEGGQPGVYEVPVGGPTRLLQAAPEDTVGIAAGRDGETVYAVDSAGVLRLLRTSSWVQVAEGLRDPSFPG